MSSATVEIRAATALRVEVTGSSGTDYVYDLTRKIITPEGRKAVGFDDPVEVPEDAAPLKRLLAFTGRRV